jgi:hypothetical protein
MNEKLIENICLEVYRRFPELRGKRPRVQPFSLERNNLANASPKFLLTFSGQATTATNKTLPCLVRVVVSAQGKILKMSMSR